MPQTRSITYKLVDSTEFPQSRADIREPYGSDFDRMVSALKNHPTKVARIAVLSDKQEGKRIGAWANTIGRRRGIPVQVRRKGMYLYVALRSG